MGGVNVHYLPLVDYLKDNSNNGKKTKHLTLSSG